MATRAAKPKVITPEGEPVADDLDETADALENFDPEQLEDIELPEALVFHSDENAAAERKEDPGTPFEFDGKRYVAYRPKDAVMVTLLAAGSMNATMADQVQCVLQWLDHCLEPIAKMELQRRIYDRHDHLEWEDLTRVMIGLLKHWEGADMTREERRAALAKEKRQQALSAGRAAKTKAATASSAGRAGATRARGTRR